MSQPSDPNRTVDEPPRQGRWCERPRRFAVRRDGRLRSVELLEEIARGGMGAILRGRDADIGRDVAVKVLLEDHRSHPELARRFLEEAPHRRPAATPRRRAGLRPGPDARRPAVLHHEAHQGPHPDGPAGGAQGFVVRPAAFPGRLRAGVPDASLRPRPRRHPPRFEAFQRDGGGLRRGAGDGLGVGQGAAARRRGRAGTDGGGVADPDAAGRAGHGGGRVGDARGRRDGDAGLHGAGAGPRRSRGRGGCVRTCSGWARSCARSSRGGRRSWGRARRR